MIPRGVQPKYMKKGLNEDAMRQFDDADTVDKVVQWHKKYSSFLCANNETLLSLILYEYIPEYIKQGKSIKDYKFNDEKINKFHEQIENQRKKIEDEKDKNRLALENEIKLLKEKKEDLYKTCRELNDLMNKNIIEQTITCLTEKQLIEEVQIVSEKVNDQLHKLKLILRSPFNQEHQHNQFIVEINKDLVKCEEQIKKMQKFYNDFIQKITIEKQQKIDIEITTQKIDLMKIQEEDSKEETKTQYKGQACSN